MDTVHYQPNLRVVRHEVTYQVSIWSNWPILDKKRGMGTTKHSTKILWTKRKYNKTSLIYMYVYKPHLLYLRIDQVAFIWLVCNHPTRALFGLILRLLYVIACIMIHYSSYEYKVYCIKIAYTKHILVY